jgi:NitT/TauT family transport system permease protein
MSTASVAKPVSFAKDVKNTIGVRKRFLRAANILFVILLLVQLLPNNATKDPFTLYTVVVSIGLEIIVIISSLLIKKEQSLNLFLDIMAFIYGFLILWTLVTAKFNLLKESLFPSPGRVFEQFVRDIDKILVNIGSSLGIIAQGYILAAVVAIPLGLFLGISVRLGNAATYISKFLGSIPPIVYIPYGIALLPTFRSVSVFVIFLAAFWPILASTMSGVLNVEKKVIDSAKVLNVGKATMMFRIILPASLPQIFIGCNQGLSVSFILLTSAEMIGARDGMGYYVKNYSDLGDYTRTIVGLLVIGIVVVVITMLFNKLQKFLLRWKA